VNGCSAKAVGSHRQRASAAAEFGNIRTVTSAVRKLQFDSAVGAEGAYSRPSANIGISLQVGLTVRASIRFRVLEQRKST
jgi:hypothetical protein